MAADGPGGSAPRVTRRVFVDALSLLTANDRDLARVVDTHGAPPLWARPPGFSTLVHIILEQQVSLASARATYQRFCDRVGPLSPAIVLSQPDEVFKACGFSRQKTRYVRELAHGLTSGAIDLSGLSRLGDRDAKARLMSVKGIGIWTADIYLLMALRRRDVWPSGDLALVIAIQEIKILDARPTREVFASLGNRYRPWRAVAARVLWHHYLSTPRRAASHRKTR